MPIPGNMLSAVAEMVDPNTSGWTALLNATVSPATGGRNGDGCLSVKSVASGEMRARTTSSYPVTEGTVYQALGDASGATVPERIGIRWLTAANTEISITWSLTTATASTSWHRISVAGPAPVGAVRAQIVVSATTGAALVVSYFENFYLGLPIRTTGNMLSFAAESPETDTSAWAAEANGTLGRQAPNVSWAVTFLTIGGHVWALTATAAGNASALCTERAPVVPGTDYMAACYLNPPASGSAVWIELRYYDAAGTQLTTARSTLAAPGTGFYRQRASAPAPAGAATCSVAVGITGATAGQVTRFETVSIGPPPQLVAGTVLPYADAGFEMGTGGWTRQSGVATLARSTPWGTGGEGSYCLVITSATATTSVIRSPRYRLTDPGLPHRLRIVEQNAVGTWQVGMAIRWYDAANNDLGTHSWVPVAVPTAAGWWGFTLSSDPPPAGATQAAAELTLVALSAGASLRVDMVTLWQALQAIESQVTEETGSATLTLRDLPIGDLLRVYRLDTAGNRTLVRGPNGLWDGTDPINTDTLRIEDYEAPLGVPFGYRAEFIDPVTGLIEWREAGARTIPWPDINRAWLKDPGNPQRNLTVTVAAQPSWTRPIGQAEYTVKNRRNKVILSGLRNGLEGEVQVWTSSDAERERLNWLLDTGGVLLWQTGPGAGVGNLYLNVSASGESREGPAQDPVRVWTLPAVEADMPVTTGINGSGGRTWQDILSEFATWQDILSAFASWEDVLLNRRKT
ncbi:hypothetical protein OG413_15510 [Streptomyces sp. NBC_01433]|uniref:hypothetical protein n=1 Tax=Streptomyces sp. NBC_01433 TaxID=2903864 RepID=UPI00225A0C43|nr:hypothetical protein [Streptomyces sp. NBC_01433]MCX4676691.1 hypothetical protein [Streptomyces sp. NBC_01433]